MATVNPPALPEKPVKFDSSGIIKTPPFYQPFEVKIMSFQVLIGNNVSLKRECEMHIAQSYRT